MLELPVLVVQPWEPEPSASAPSRPARAWRRNIRDTAGKHVGTAHSEPAWRRRGLAWLSPPAVSAREAEDEPLVFTARRSWLFPFWEVRDAEEYPVGWLTTAVLRDRWERTLAVREVLSGGDNRFRAPQGEALASVERSKGEVRLQFGPLVEGDPFARMLLLAAVLVGR